MSTFYVRKNGSGTHTTIQSAIYDALAGDIIDIGAGIFNENIEFYKPVQLIGAGQDLTFIEGQFAAQVFIGGSFYQGEDVITVPSTANLVRGRRVTAANFTANSRVSEIISSTQFKVSPATVATAIAPKTAVSIVSGSNTITLPNTTSLVVGMKVTGSGVSGLITAINATTKVITLDTPNTASGSSVVLTFRLARINVQVTMASSFPGSQIPATIQVMNVALDGWKIKGMTVTGFDNPNPNAEVAGIAISAAAHSNWSIEDCKVIANGDSALATVSSFTSTNGVIKDCTFSGKTFMGNNPATGNQYTVWNVPRQLVVVQAASGINFINNQVTGVTGGLTVDGLPSFNTAVTVDSANSTVSGNTMNGTFGYGYALRVRGVGSVAENNTNYSFPGNENSGYLIGPTGSQLSGMTVGSNSSITTTLVESSQVLGDSFVSFEMSKEILKQNSVVSSHPTFSDEANWNMVSYVFKHDSSSRRLVGSFKDFDSAKKAKLKTNMEAGDRFELHKIILATSPRDLLVLKRSQISGASSFDFDLLNDGPEASNGGGGNGGGETIQPLVSIDFTQGVLPQGTLIHTGPAPDMSNGSAKFTSSSTQMSVPYSNFIYTSFESYKVRVYVKSASKNSSYDYTVGLQLNSLFYSTATAPIMECAPFFYGSYNPEFDLQAKAGSYIEYTFTAGTQWNDNFYVNLHAMISPSGSTTGSIEITKIEILPV
jgi:hypothetical protein